MVDVGPGYLVVSDQRIIFWSANQSYSIFFTTEHIIAFGQSSGLITLSIYNEEDDHEQETSQDDIFDIIKEMK